MYFHLDLTQPNMCLCVQWKVNTCPWPRAVATACLQGLNYNIDGADFEVSVQRERLQQHL